MFFLQSQGDASSLAPAKNKNKISGAAGHSPGGARAEQETSAPAPLETW